MFLMLLFYLGVLGFWMGMNYILFSLFCLLGGEGFKFFQCLMLILNLFHFICMGMFIGVPILWGFIFLKEFGSDGGLLAVCIFALSMMDIFSLICVISFYMNSFLCTDFYLSWVMEGFIFQDHLGEFFFMVMLSFVIFSMLYSGEVSLS